MKKKFRLSEITKREQIGQAVARLDAMFKAATAAKDSKTALQAQRELNRLLDLYTGPGRSESGGEEVTDLRRQLDLIAGHLLPLKLADEGYPVEEHARLAAEFIRTAKR